jgi:hypothetical protein
MSRLAWRLAWIALVLSAFYAMTAIVTSGCEPSYSLVLKPWPMWGWGFGGAERECNWAIAYPGTPEPWWLNAPQLVYASMEDANGGALSILYFLGLYFSFALWALTFAIGAIGAVRQARQPKAPA